MTQNNNTPSDTYTTFDWIGFGAIIAFAFLVFVTMIHAPLQSLLHAAPTWAVWTGIVLLAALAVLAAIHFVISFTRDLPTKGASGSAAMCPRLRTIFAYAYGFMLLSLGICVAPFLVATHGTNEQPKDWRPAGVVLACKSNNCGSVAEEDPQWFLHIGSTISLPASTYPDTQEPANMLSAADSGEATSSRGYAVMEGGLVVPLYVVLLALAGGAVSLTRRLPEYQVQAASNSIGPSESPEQRAISAVRARELVVFQIMQVFTAPLIAIVAFAVFDPDTVTAGALIGFLSGFSSETILLRLRKMADSLSGRKS